VKRTTIHDLLAAARERITRLTPDEALEAQTQGAQIVDTRDSEDRAREGVIPGSIHAPLSVLPWRVDPTAEFTDNRLNDQATRLIIVCNDGYSSSLAAAMLVDVGFENAADLRGGFRAWSAGGLPVDR